MLNEPEIFIIYNTKFLLYIIKFFMYNNCLYNIHYAVVDTEIFMNFTPL